MNDVVEYNYYEQIKAIGNQNLHCVWQALQSEQVWKEVRGLFPIFEQEDLLSIVRKFQIEAKRQDNLPSKSKAIPANPVRDLWLNSEYKLSSQRWEHKEQSAKQLADIMPFLSYEDALELAEIWYYLSLIKSGLNSHRVARLKALGNAQVPQQIYPIFKAIADIECGKYK